jgi:hypothetical protein
MRNIQVWMSLHACVGSKVRTGTGIYSIPDK